MIDYELRVNSFKRSNNCRLACIIRNMTSNQRQLALERIQSTTLFSQTPANPEAMKFIVERLRK